jgi:HD-GYP domain-containing protein (c-di-GMP phosphodiesterase class II)/DNA-binding CsgD family transcriptional regulator
MAGIGGAESARMRLAEPLAALSLITDLALGKPAETAIRAGIVAACLTERMGLGAREQRNVYYATLLRSVGCTSTSHEIAALFGDDIEANRKARALGDVTLGAVARMVIDLAGRDLPLVDRVGLLGMLAIRGKSLAVSGVIAHCEVGARMAERFELDEEVKLALEQVGERWDGSGYPRHLRGQALALPMRVAILAHIAVEADEAGGSEAAAALVRRLAGKLLDPNVARDFVADARALLAESSGPDPWGRVLALEPDPKLFVSARALTNVARGFADVVDLKCPFFHGHSNGVARLAEEAGRRLGRPQSELDALRLAGLLHDLGRAGVPTSMWEKPGPLSVAEWERVRLHPYLTERILTRAAVLSPLARLASLHHERLDGSGYHRGVKAGEINVPARILAAADVCHALTEERPHRPAMTTLESAAELQRMAAAGRLDREAVAAVCEAAGAPRPRTRGQYPAGLSDREVEVLRLLARGETKKEIAARLHVAASTAHTHVVHIYEKTGVTSRAAVALFAMEHDLLRD